MVKGITAIIVAGFTALFVMLWLAVWGAALGAVGFIAWSVFRVLAVK